MKKKQKKNEIMITQKAFIEKHKEYLNKKFVEKYPDGQFVIQRRCFWPRGFYVNIYVNFRRKTSHACPLWPGAFGIKHSNEDSFYFIRSQNNSFGKVTIYKTLPKFLEACKKYLIKKRQLKNFCFSITTGAYRALLKKFKKIYIFVIKNVNLLFPIKIVLYGKYKIWKEKKQTSIKKYLKMQ